MDIRRRVPVLPMHFEFTKTRPQLKPKSVLVTSSRPETSSEPSTQNVCVDVKIITKDESVDQIEQQVNLNQQIVAEWDNKLELMRTREIEMRRSDVIREMNTLIAIWKNANP